jgi:hypothetical protein
MLRVAVYSTQTDSKLALVMKDIYLFIYLFILLSWVGIHCDIYKSSYNVLNISYLNSPPGHLKAKVASHSRLGVSTSKV